MLTKLRNKKGFTLIELMIVVAIIGILSAIAIPNFVNFRYKAKTSEAKANLGAIRSCEESYKAEMETYLACPVTPAAVPGITKADFTGGGVTAFNTIGFEPSGQIYYQYAVAQDPNGTSLLYNFYATATGDLDGDSANGAFAVTKDSSQVVNLAPANY
ncbi:MAG: type IV pilin protein [bacterium]